MSDSSTDLSGSLAGLSSGTGSSLSGGEITSANVLVCCSTGLSAESGLELGSTSRGEAFCVTDNDAALERCCPCNGAGVCLSTLGDETGILDTCERKAEKEGTDLCARDVRSRTPGYVCA